MTERDIVRLLRWYPEEWRDRYGRELIALLEDTYGERTPPLRCRLGLVRSGILERSRLLGLTGSSCSMIDGVRAGALVVLWAWVVIVLASVEFANIAEGWRRAMPSAGRAVPTGGYAVVLTAGLFSAGVVSAAGALCVGPLIRFIRDGGWSRIRGRTIRSVALTIVPVGCFFVMKVWSGHLDAHQRDGGYLPYGLVAVVFAVSSASSLLSWAVTATAAARGLRLDARLARRLGACAVWVAAALSVLAIGSVVWWVAIASRAPWFLAGTAPGTRGAVAPTMLVATCGVMAVAAAVAAAGAHRTAACRRRLT